MITDIAQGGWHAALAPDPWRVKAAVCTANMQTSHVHASSRGSRG